MAAFGLGRCSEWNEPTRARREPSGDSCEREAMREVDPMSKTKVRALFIPLAVLVVGCASPIDPATSQCASPPSSKDEQGPAAVLAVANGHHIIDGTWLNGRTASVATIDLSVGDKLADSTTGCGGTLRLDATATVKTRDGLIDARGTVLKFDQPYVAHLDVPLPDLSEAFAHPDASLGSLPAAWPLQRFTAPTLVLTITADGLRADVVVDEERVVGRWTTDVFQIP